MNSVQFLYLMSLSLQLSGALILIVFYWRRTEYKVLNRIFPVNTSIHRDDDNTVIISKEKLYRAYKEVLQNRIAFILIAAGYLLCLFGNADGICAWLGFIVVLVVSIMLLGIGNYVSHIISKVRYKKDCIYDYEELLSILESDVDTNIITQEIDDICK